jgi:hypothetical protein
MTQQLIAAFLSVLSTPTLIPYFTPIQPLKIAWLLPLVLRTHTPAMIYSSALLHAPTEHTFMVKIVSPTVLMVPISILFPKHAWLQQAVLLDITLITKLVAALLTAQMELLETL